MCDNCKTLRQVLRLVGVRAPVDGEDVREPVELAERRLRCYYECVTADLGPEDFELAADEDDDEDWFPPQ